MALTFKDIQDDVKRRSTRNQSGTEFDTATKVVINSSLFRLCYEALWKPLRRDTTFATVDGTEEYVLAPQIADRFFLWHEDYGYPYVCWYIPEQDFLSMGIDKDAEGTPTHYRTWTTDMIKTQPTAASVVSIASSSASDTNIGVTVYGTVSSYPDSETITTDASDGTTSVSGSKSFTNIDRIVKNASSVGRISATSNSAAVTLAVLPVGDTTAGIMYRKVKLYPVPDSVITMNVYYYKDPYRLVSDNDVHELGHRFDEALILLSTAKINYETNKDEADKYFGLYKDELAILRKTNVDKIDWFPKLKKPNDGRGDSLVHPYLSYTQAGSQFGMRVY